MEETKEKKEKKGLKWLGWVVAFPVPLTLTLVRKGGRVRRKAAAIAGAWVAYTVLAYAGATAEVNRLTKPHSYPEPQVIERPYVEKAEEPEAPKEDQVFPRGIDFNDEYTFDFIGVGETRALLAVVTPINADNRNIIWESKDETVATVDQNGIITGVAPGIVNIYAKTEANGLVASRTIRVKKAKQVDIYVETQREGGYNADIYKITPLMDVSSWNWDTGLSKVEGEEYSFSGFLVMDREYEVFVNVSQKSGLQIYGIDRERFKVTDAELASDFTKTLTVKVEEDLPPFEVTFYFDLK
ncbi:MAG: Ig domain-containing protein [Lachnospiraceae bacterium]|nr:Ig domain-containing protein [Lachnospiraceae bacterium]